MSYLIYQPDDKSTPDAPKYGYLAGVNPNGTWKWTRARDEAITYETYDKAQLVLAGDSRFKTDDKVMGARATLVSTSAQHLDGASDGPQV